MKKRSLTLSGAFLLLLAAVFMAAFTNKKLETPKQQPQPLASAPRVQQRMLEPHKKPVAQAKAKNTFVITTKAVMYNPEQPQPQTTER